MKHIFVWVYSKIIIDIIAYTPTIVGDLLRKIYIKILSKSCGDNFVAHTGVQFFYPWRLSIGNNVSISRFTIVNSHSELIIKDNVMIGPNCNIMTANHGFKDISIPINVQLFTSNKLTINEDVWIGNGVVINSGSKEINIAKGIIIASNSVVNKFLDKEYSIYGGVPARFIKYRNNE
ncbi:MAG: hypothetical protein COB17_09370 [Sulfurimonas sp.]|nr:MAG: hypothetical protein COB17_09370 [Sulfurimonas sp.]